VFDEQISKCSSAAKERSDTTATNEEKAKPGQHRSVATEVKQLGDN